MVISSRGLARLLFLLVLSGFPFFSIVSGFFPEFGNIPSIFFRCVVLVLSIVVFALSISRARLTGGYALLLVFVFLYSVRLIADVVFIGPQLILPNAILFFGVTIPPMIALATSGYDGSDERFFGKWLVYFGIVQCFYFSFVWVVGSGFNEWAEYGAETNRLALERLNPISMGHAAMTAIIAATVLLIDSRTGRDAKIVCYVAIGLASVAFLAANSRGPALAGAATLFWLFSRSLKRSFLLVIVCIAALAAAEYFTGLLSVMLERFTWDTDTNGSNLERVSVQAKAIASFISNPFFGAFSVDPTSADGDYPHNIFIESAMAMGVFGLALILLIVFAAWRKISTGLGKSCPLISALFIQKLVAFQFSGAIYFSDAFFAVLGFVLVARIAQREPNPPTAVPSRNMAIA